jgi:hypothetical protein
MQCVANVYQNEFSFFDKKIANYSFKTLARIEKYARLGTNKKNFGHEVF